MAKCEVCGKGVSFGIKVSHSHRRSNKAFKPNVKRVKAVVNGTPKHVNVCSAPAKSKELSNSINQDADDASFFICKIKRSHLIEMASFITLRFFLRLFQMKREE